MIKNWLAVYLPVERAMSPNTIRSYRESMNQYLDFIATSEGVPLASVTFDMMNSKTLNAFLDHLQTDFHFSVAARNNRLAAIRAFIDYASACSAEYISTAMDVDKIKSQRDNPYSKVDYMTETAVKVILKMPDLSTKKGRRDLAILSLIYDSGSRIGELLGIRLCDLRLNLSTPTVTLHGKGNVIRTVPITYEAYVILQKYLKEFQSEVPMTSETPLFYVDTILGNSQYVRRLSAKEWRNTEQRQRKNVRMFLTVFIRICGVIRVRCTSTSMVCLLNWLRNG